MDSIKNTFHEANASLSQSIYQTFYSGAVVNRKFYSAAKSEFIEAPAYREIAVNENHYRQLYWHLGYHLEHDELGDYYFLKVAHDEEIDTDTFDEASLKIMAILTIFSRLVTNRGQAIETLTQAVQGLSQADLDMINNDSEMLSIFRSLKLKDAEDALSFLKKRGFAFKVDNKRHVLSKGAKAMIDTIIERQKALQGEDNLS